MNSQSCVLISLLRSVLGLRIVRVKQSPTCKFGIPHHYLRLKNLLKRNTTNDKGLI